ncbi:MAG: hypothetical protein Q7R95_04115 [bacterium]|nr:hypothetical protein [bacterium]
MGYFDTLGDKTQVHKSSILNKIVLVCSLICVFVLFIDFFKVMNLLLLNKVQLNTLIKGLAGRQYNPYVWEELIIDCIFIIFLFKKMIIGEIFIGNKLMIDLENILIIFVSFFAIYYFMTTVIPGGYLL